MITEDYVSFEVAKLLKEKGFDGTSNTIGTYNDKGEFYLYRHKKGYNHNHLHAWYSAPTLQMACKWLRDVYKIFIQINIVPYTTVTMEQCYYFFTIYRERKAVYWYMVDYYSTYEEATEAALKHCLEKMI